MRPQAVVPGAADLDDLQSLLSEGGGEPGQGGGGRADRGIGRDDPLHPGAARRGGEALRTQIRQEADRTLQPACKTLDRIARSALREPEGEVAGGQSGVIGHDDGERLVLNQKARLRIEVLGRDKQHKGAGRRPLCGGRRRLWQRRRGVREGDGLPGEP